MRALTAFFIAAFILVSVPAVLAQEDTSLERRIDLAKQLQEVLPVKEQINSAIERYTAQMTQQQREVYARALASAFNYKALEKISVDAYAEVYDEAELEAMLEYHSKPEAASIAAKTNNYAEIVYPEIIRMLDRAMMRIKTGGTSDQ